ncbi:hinge connector of long tail fiber protein distal connector [Vibrio phage EniLVp02]
MPTNSWLSSNGGQRVRAEGLEVRHFEESNQIQHVLHVRGHGTQPITLDHNGTELIPTGWSTGNGFILTVFDVNFDVSFRAGYSTTNATSLNSLVDKLNSLTTEFFVLQSRGRFYSNAALDQVMTDKLASPEWRGFEFLNQYPYGYACAAYADMGIVNERLVYTDPSMWDPEFTVAANAVDKFGLNGFGAPLIEFTNLTGEFLIGDLGHCLPGEQYIWVGVVGFVNSNIPVDVFVEFLNASGGYVKGEKITLTSRGVVEKKDVSFLIPLNAAQVRIRRNNTTQGKVMVVNAYKSGKDVPPETVSVKQRREALANLSLSLSPVSANPYKPVSWLLHQVSDSNLHASVEMGQQVTGVVDWATFALDDNKTRARLSTTATSATLSTDPIEIDPSQPYFCSIWVRNTNKTQGQLKFGIKGMDDTYTPVTWINVSDRGENPEPYFQSPDVVDLVTDGRFILFQGWILPHDWTAQQCEEFRDRHLNFFGGVNGEDFTPLANGIGVVHPGDCGGMVQMKPDLKYVFLEVVDGDNSGSQSDTDIALPSIARVTSAAFAPGTVYALDINPV